MAVIVLFRRDLRLFDHTAFIRAAQSGEPVLACFIADPRQIKEHPYRSMHALQFMIDSLKNLSEEIAKSGGRLFLLYGRQDEVIAALLKQTHAQSIYAHYDYTPFAIQRDEEIRQVCAAQGATFIQYHDYLLHPPGSVLKDDRSAYTIFTPFYKKAKTHTIAQPQEIPPCTWYKQTLGLPQAAYEDILPASQYNTHVIQGGRMRGTMILDRISTFENYKQTRDIPSLGTTQLSAHLKFGTLSPREVYHKCNTLLGNDHSIIQELHWRDFFTHIAYHFPFVFGRAFKEQYDAIAWEKNDVWLTAWQKGETGFPLVDAGMRELNATGFMHNRVRMVVASFLTKDLLISWREGERYFARKLVDYDPSVNNGNWQWAASTGCDAQPYFRIFNPWRQQQRFDPECLYIKQWIQELRSYSAKEIHGHEHKHLAGYVPPLVLHDVQSKKAKELFSRL